ncbi:MAG: helix-turn-helix domain-containing protein [bacterium]|nr:helix-turn-helix domain-containing protein [bacterium]
MPAREPLNLDDRLALRPKEAARALGMSERKFREIQSELPRVRLGGVILFPKRALEAWLEAQAATGVASENEALDTVLGAISGVRRR